jgi:WD40 repeat protein/tRNA A-37 threonylcarbamoyl transferase component Bud32
MNAFTCDDTEALLAERMVGELDTARQRELEEHLGACEACFELARDLDGSGVEDTLLELGASPVSDFPDLREVATDNYVRGREIGRGGMGRIVRARDRRLGRSVAIKELLDTKMHARFVREARLTARLQHPAIVNVHEAGHWPSGEPFYAMKYVAGRPLAEVVAEKKTTAERLALLPSLITVAEAVAYAHSQRIIHRDLKPQNILVGDFGETVVIDWGLAKDLSSPEPDSAGGPYRIDGPSLTAAGAGTPAYMPPKQREGDDVDERADVYALGATLFHVLSGYPPGDGANLDDAPRELRTIVEKAMESNPGLRYSSAAELAQELRRFLAGKLVAAHPYTPRELVARWVRRYRAALALAAVFLAGVAAFGAVTVSRFAAARRVADTSLRQVLVERGQKDLETGHPLRALAFFKGALDLGADTPALRMLLSPAIRAADAIVAEVQVRILGGFPHSGDQALALSDDGSTLVVRGVAPEDGCEFERFVHITLAGKELAALAHGECVRSAVFASDKKSVITVAGHAISTWDPVTGKLLRSLQTEDFRVLAIALDGTRAVTGELRGTTKLWDPVAGTTRTLIASDGKPFKVNSFVLDYPDTNVVAFDGSGSRITIADGDRIGIWDWQTGALIRELRANWVRSVRLSPDGKLVAAVEGRLSNVRLWNVETGEGGNTFATGATTMLWRGSGDALTLLTAGGDGIVRIWDRSGNAIGAFDFHSRPVVALAGAAGGTRVASADLYGRIVVFDLPPANPLSFRSSVGAMRVVGDRLYVVADGNLEEWELDRGQPTLKRSVEVGAVRSLKSGPVGSLAVSKETVIASDAQGDLINIDLRNQRKRRIAEHAQVVGLSETAERMVLDRDDTAQVIDFAGKVISTWERRCLRASCDMSRDGRWVASGSSAGVTIWSADTGRTVRVLDEARWGYRFATFSKSGETLVVHDVSGRSVVWDRATGLRMGEATDTTWNPGELIGHRGSLSAAAFTDDGERIVCGDFWGMAYVWDAHTGWLLLTAELPFPVTGVADVGGGRAALLTDDRLWLWDIHLADPADATRAASRSPFVVAGEGIRRR